MFSLVQVETFPSQYKPSIVSSGRLLLLLKHNADVAKESMLAVKPSHLPAMLFSSDTELIDSLGQVLVEPGVSHTEEPYQS